MEDVVSDKVQEARAELLERIDALEKRLDGVASSAVDAMNVVVNMARRADAALEGQVGKLSDEITRFGESLNDEAAERKKGDAARAQDARVDGLKKAVVGFEDKLVKLGERLDREALAREAGDREKEA